ncbi:unconventional myosin-IXa, partial [Cynoglossus semilaevis]|uniref:unconventional myosin-IXa n=1 Tax=Cynoglossus semilaevis TaxID=244447 RepID=UPI0007DCAAC0
LTEQIENLQKEKEELTFELLALEPRASDDETLESEASIGTADSCENLNVDSEGTMSDFSTERGQVVASPQPRRSDGRSPRRHILHRQPESVDSVDSFSSVSSYSSSSHYYPSFSANTQRFRFHSKSPPQGSVSAQAPVLTAFQSFRSNSLDCSSTGDHESLYDESPQFSSRGTFNPEKGKQKLRGGRHSRHHRNSGGHSRDPPDITQPVVVYGNNEFMV